MFSKHYNQTTLEFVLIGFALSEIMGLGTRCNPPQRASESPQSPQPIKERQPFCHIWQK